MFKSNLRSRPEIVADFLVSKLTGWVVSFYTGSGKWGSRLYGMVEPLPAIVMVARDISRAKLPKPVTPGVLLGALKGAMLFACLHALGYCFHTKRKEKIRLRNVTTRVCCAKSVLQ
eukprot:402587-Pelagomonas_calceolata.AAC.1